jgi:predicted DNA-binding transcriptional regulator AlpA
MEQPTEIGSVDTSNVSSPELLVAKDLASLLAVSERHLWRMRSGGLLPDPIHLGRSVRWRRREILEWLDAGAPDRLTWQRMRQRQLRIG